MRWLTVVSAIQHTSRRHPEVMQEAKRWLWDDWCLVLPCPGCWEVFQPGASVSHQLGSCSACSAPPVCYQHAQMSVDRRVLTEVEPREQRLMLHEVSVWRPCRPLFTFERYSFLLLSHQPDWIRAKLAKAWFITLSCGNARLHGRYSSERKKPD